jgi:sec-independent protein translocase protein TatC
LIVFISLFYLGIFSAFKTLPIGIEFLLSFNESEFILRTQNYFQLISRISILFGISFQTPLVIYFLINRGIISKNIFTDNRKEIFVGVLIFSAIITPTGDPVTLFIFTLPLYMLIELVLYLSKSK